MRILAFDLETSPNTGFSWGKYEQTIPKFIQESYLLCYSYRWLDEKKTHVVSLPDFAAYKKDKTDDTQIVQSLWELFDTADILLAHNGDKFDIKYANSRFLVHKLKPPSHYRTIDTLKIARSRFKLNSNKLNDIGELLDIGKKVETGGFDLWLGCMQGDEKSWKKMKKYNKQDVELLIEIYEALKVWHPTHPNLFIEKLDICGLCGSDDVIRWGFYYTNSTRYQRLKCKDCGANLRSGKKGGKPLHITK